jgi:hypothetical protein
MQARVLADKSDRDCLKDVVLACCQAYPLPSNKLSLLNKLGGLLNGVELKRAADGGQEILVLQKQRHAVCRGDIVNGNNLVRLHLVHVLNLLDGFFLK